MTANLPASDLSLIDGALKEYGGVPGSLITVLQHAQQVYGYLPEDVMDHIAERMDIPPAKVFGVATFYTQFRFEPVGKYFIMLCQGTACFVNGSKAIEEALVSELGVTSGRTTPDGLFTLLNVACLGCCSLSPVMMINDRTYGNLTPDSTVKIIRELRSEAMA